MAEDKKQTTELTDLETVEVSLVDKGANRRTFAIRKSENDKMNLIDAILQAPFEKSDELIERLQKAELSEQAAEGVKSALQLLSAFQEELPESLMNELMGMIGMSEEKAEDEDEKADEPAEEATEEVAEEAAADEEDEEKTDKMEDEDEEEEDEDKMKKRLAALPKDVRGMVEQLWKSNRSEIAKREVLQLEIKKAKEEKRLGDFIKKARDNFSSLPAKPEELGAFMSKLDGKAAAFAQSLLKSANEMIAKGGVTSEIGNSTSDAQQIDSISKAEQMAAEIVKSDGVSLAVAKGRVWKNNPGLYAEYQQEKGK